MPNQSALILVLPTGKSQEGCNDAFMIPSTKTFSRCVGAAGGLMDPSWSVGGTSKQLLDYLSQTISFCMAAEEDSTPPLKDIQPPCHKTDGSGRSFFGSLSCDIFFGFIPRCLTQSLQINWWQGSLWQALLMIKGVFNLQLDLGQVADSVKLTKPKSIIQHAYINQRLQM